MDYATKGRSGRRRDMKVGFGKTGRHVRILETDGLKLVGGRGV